MIDVFCNVTVAFEKENYLVIIHSWVQAASLYWEGTVCRARRHGQGVCWLCVLPSRMWGEWRSLELCDVVSLHRGICLYEIERRDWLTLIKVFILHWSIVDLQCCVSFRCTAKWLSYTYTYIHCFSNSFPI